MPTVLNDLAQRLQLNQLIEQYLQGIEELIIIPHLWLHQIPFAALPVDWVEERNPTNTNPEDVEFHYRLTQSTERGKLDLKEGLIPLASPLKRGKDIGDTRGMGGTPRQPAPPIPENQQYLGDLFRLRILPSCQILNYCHQRPKLNQQITMGIVENASEDLPYTAYECETLASKYNIEPSKRLQGRQATVKECLQLANQVPILHLSHHGSANPTNSLESALIFSDRALTLGELINCRFPHLLDGFLNNCETHYSVNEITDDLLTIATALLCAGARSVVSTLWTVDDCASALFSIFYYDFRNAGSSRSQALQQAQQKLRTLTGKQLEDEYYQPLDQHLQKLHQQALISAQDAQGREEEHQKYEEIAKKIDYQRETSLPSHCRAKYPFASSFYWAGFISQGLA